MFSHLLESTYERTDKGRKAYFLIGTATVWVLLFATVIVTGILFYDAKLVQAWDVTPIVLAPPPPPPPPPPGGLSKPITSVRQVTPQSYNPTNIPTKIETPPTSGSDSELPTTGGMPGGLPGGVEGGMIGGVPTGIVGGVPNSVGGGEPPAPPPTVPTKPHEEEKIPPVVRKSEGVIRGNAISRPTPEYPPLAKASHVAGDVLVELIISENGSVVSARVISGHVLLQQAALSAARQWQFRPTLLNNTPVKVTGILTFRFTL